MAHAANALCLIRVQQTLTTVGSPQFDAEIAAGEHFSAEKGLGEKEEDVTGER